MFLKEKFDFSIIDSSITVEDLEQFCHENDIGIQFHTDSEVWCAFSQWYGRKHGLDAIASTSFAYIVSALFTGLGVSANTEIYFRENEISFDSIEYLNQCRVDYGEVVEEVTIAKMLFKYIFNLYRDRLWEYEYKDHKICFRCGESTLARLMNHDGETKSEKIMKLIYLSD